MASPFQGNASVAAKLPARNILRADQFTPEWCSVLFRRALEIEKMLDPEAAYGLRRELYRLREEMSEKIVLLWFYEKSTRTRTSFDLAAKRLGMQVVSEADAPSFSSVAKGESFDDTMDVLGALRPDAIVTRTKIAGSAAEAARILPHIPIINAGDGAAEHPSQALLDLLTIQRKLGKIDGITIVIGGDLRYGRAAKSLARLLAKYRDVRMIFISPRILRIPEDIQKELASSEAGARGITYEETDDLAYAFRQADAVYWTRIQRERFPFFPLGWIMYRMVRGKFSIGIPEADLLRDHAVIMHPLPINRFYPEIKPEVKKHPRAGYIPQVWNGEIVRCALLEWAMRSEWWNRPAIPPIALS